MDASNKVMGTSFDRVPTTWSAWCDSGSAADFKDINIISKSQFSDWKKVLDGQPIPSGIFRDKYETGSIDTYGLTVSLPRKAIVNDDLGMLTDTLQQIGSGAALGIEDLVYQTLVGTALAGPSITETSRDMFNATDGNLISSSGTVSVTNLGTARQTLRKLSTYGPNDKGVSRARYTGISARYLLTGVDNETSIDQVLGSVYDPSTSNDTQTVNPFGPNGRNRLEPIYSEALQYYLTSASHGNKPNAWYLVADKSAGWVAMRVYFLNGQQRPVLRRKESTVGEPLGISMDGYLDYGVAVPEWRAAVCNDGA
jgi:hypothetical protein